MSSGEARGDAVMCGASGERDEQAGEPPPDSPIEIDLYCLKCGYNLRGLSGDPVRCPECGCHSSREDLACPPEMVGARMRRMEISGLVCWLIVALTVTLVAAAFLFKEAAFGVCALCAAPVPWLIAATEFKNGSLGERGWRRALAYNHAYWLGICSPLAIPGAVYVVTLIASDSRNPHASASMNGVDAVLLTSALIAAVAIMVQVFKKLNPPRRAMLRRLVYPCVRFEVEALRKLDAEDTR